MQRYKPVLFGFFVGLGISNLLTAQTVGFTGLKADAVESVESMTKLTQEIVDSLFSFS